MNQTRALLAATLFLTITALPATPLVAGVVFEIESTDHDASPPTTDTVHGWADEHNLKMEILPGDGGGSRGEVIFRGDRREMLVVDHDEKSYIVMDEAAMKGMADQFAQAMSQMEEALENVPEEQRAMVEQMMKQQMPQAPAERPREEVRKTAERGEHNGYPCVKYEVLRDGQKVSELWVTDWDKLDGGTEIAGAFVAAAEFFREMMETFASASGGAGGIDDMIDDNLLAQMNELDGFPVVVLDYEDGDLEGESKLRSSRRESLEPSVFEPPTGYKRREMSSN